MAMDPVSAVGLAVSTLSLLRTANSLLTIVTKNPRRLQCTGDPLGNVQQRQRLKAMLVDFIHSLESAASVSAAASAYTLKELQDIKSLLEILDKKPCPRCPSFVNCIWSCATAPVVYSKLEEAESKLQNLRKEVLVLEGTLILHSQIPIISNETVELPLSHVGLDRSKNALDFLQQSQQQALRVIGIYGQPGVGKTTILNKIWDEASRKEPFAVRAYVQVGHDVTPQILCNLQSSILEQLGGRKQEFPSDAHGKGKLVEHFLELRSSNKPKPMFLAVDNVWEPHDLQRLLPSDLSSDRLPPFSCIVLTSRQLNVLKALLNICHLQEYNHVQVFVFAPSCLSPEDSKALSVESASMSAAEHVELLEALVPLCGGLPLALNILGSVFRDEAKREGTEWKALVKQMDLPGKNQGQFPQEALPVMKALDLSYQRLQPYHKAAFLDVVHFFYGWPWETVASIVDVHVLEDLKSSSLLSEVEDDTKCNQSALKQMVQCREKPFYDRFPRKVVTMHDLTLKFGESLSREAIIRVDQGNACDFWNDGVLEVCTFFEASKLRNFALIRPYNMQVVSPHLEFLKKATNLQMLLLISEDLESCSTVLQAGTTYINASPNVSHGRQLRYLSLCNWESSSLVMGAMAQVNLK